MSQYFSNSLQVKAETCKELALFDTLQFVVKILKYHRISKLPKSQRMKIAHARWRRLLEVLRKVPFYQERMLNMRQEPESLQPFDKATYHRWELAQRLYATDPTMLASHINKALRDHAEHCDVNKTPIKPFEYEGKSYLAYSTSGSSGRTISLVKSLSYLEDLVALQIARGSSEPKTLVNAWRKWQSPPRWAVMLRGPGAFPGISLLSNQPQVASRFVNKIVLDIATLPWDSVRKRLLDFQPNIITTYPSTLVRIAQEEWPLSALNLAVTMSEPFTAVMKQTVQQHFPDAMVSDHYAMGECPILTTACPAGRGAHVNDDMVSCQALRENGIHCDDGEASAQVLISDFVNTVQPFVNYLIEDQIIMNTNQDDALCACGSRMPLVVSIEGRNNDKVKLPSGFVIDNVLLRGLVTRYPSIIDYQLEYEDSTPPRMRLNLVLEDQDRSEDVAATCRIAETLSSMTPERIPCIATVVNALPVNQKTGKSQRFVFSNN